jgi:hypothetical protein
MKQINIIIVVLAAIIVTHGTAISSGMNEKNKKSWIVQEEIYKLSNEFKSYKREIHLQREEERRRKQYRQEVERKKN